ncbi:hypothetical protein QEN19_002371 [Hanseniaspora menglaensis]
MCFSFVNGKPKSGISSDSLCNLQMGQYYSNWSPYAPHNFFPSDIDMRHTTHIYYSFISINEKNGSVYLQDNQADINMQTAKMNDYGLIMQFNHMRRNNDYFNTKDMPIKNNAIPDFNPASYSLTNQKNFKLIMSIGGWSQNKSFLVLSKDPKYMDNFIKSCIDLVISNGFDGIDIDWEYPTKHIEVQTYTEIFKRLRHEFDELEKEIFGKDKTKNWFHLSSAIPCDKDILKKMNLKEIEPFIDNWNLMAYDLSGEWSEETGFHSNLFQSDDKNGLSIDSVVQYLLKNLKLRSNKIILGIPLYGRSFTNVKAIKSKVIGVPFKGVDSDFDKDSPGIWPYHAIFDLNYNAYYDQNLVAAYVYNSKKKHLIVFDDFHCLKRKAKYITEMKLGGAFFWEANGERVSKFQERILPYFSDYNCLAFDKKSTSIWNTKELLNYFKKIDISKYNHILSKQHQKVYEIMKLPEDEE